MAEGHVSLLRESWLRVFGSVETMRLGHVDAKRGRGERYGQKEAWHAATERGTGCA